MKKIRIKIENFAEKRSKISILAKLQDVCGKSTICLKKLKFCCVNLVQPWHLFRIAHNPIFFFDPS